MKCGLVGTFAFALPLLVPVNLALAGVRASFRFPLSDFSGPVRSQWAQLAVDRERNELYSLRPRKHDIRVFDEHGMEIFAFGEGIAGALDVAIGDDGDIFLLTKGHQTAVVQRLNYRGERVSEISLQNVPETFSKFTADYLVYSQGSLYLVDSNALKVVVTDEEGRFKKSHDLNGYLRPFVTRLDRESKQLADYDWKQKKLEYIGVNGFTVDDQGNMFFTVPELFAAFKLSADGELREFGRSGGGRGKFGVAAGIATDELGYVYVSDRLRCVVLVFDPDLQFQTEFGYRGDHPGNLIAPDDLAIDNGGNVYVGQAANRGVSVFKIVHQDAFREEASDAISMAKTSAAGTSTATESTAEKSTVEKSTVEKSMAETEAAETSAAEKGAAETSTAKTRARFGESGRSIEEAESARQEFVVDDGADAAEAASEAPGWAFEEDGSNQEEENVDEAN